MTNKTASFNWYDDTGSAPVPTGHDTLGNRSVPRNLLNVRTFPNSPDGYGNSMIAGDATVSDRGSKAIIWSSEGYTSLGNSVPNGLTVVAVTAPQKLATGTSSNTNIAAQTGILAAQQPLDFSPYRQVLAMINFVSFTAGSSPAITFELDMQDDTGTPVVFPLWTSAALTAAGKLLVAAGTGLPFAQAAAAPATAPTSFTAFAAPTNWTLAIVPLPLAPQGLFKWTVTGSPTAAVWTAWIYGIR